MTAKALEEELPRGTPDIGMEDDEVELLEVEYSDRAPDDWVASGTIGGATGPGRNFPSWDRAEVWARFFYGPRFKGRVKDAPEDSLRWAFVIRGRGQPNERSDTN